MEPNSFFAIIMAASVVGGIVFGFLASVTTSGDLVGNPTNALFQLIVMACVLFFVIGLVGAALT